MCDNASVHRSEYTKKWVDIRNISGHDWPTNFQVLNNTENIYSILVRSVHMHCRQFETVQELSVAITDAWMSSR